MNPEIEKAISHYKQYGFIPQDQQGIVIDFITRLYEAPAELPEKRNLLSKMPHIGYNDEVTGFNECLDLITPQYNKLKAELEQAKTKITELENTDNLRREMLEQARKEIAELKRIISSKR